MTQASPAARSHTNPRRRFIRHTADVPIEVRSLTGEGCSTEQGMNVSVGGISFTSEQELELGTTIEIGIPTVEPPFQARARVVWSSPEADGYCIGAQFLDASDAFRARMVEQVCSIERYREEVRQREGRQLSTQEAAAEWIGNYADRFPES